jgi:hypothetical protein
MRDGRGLAIYTQFRDTYGTQVTVKDSSAAGRRCCWIFGEGTSPGGTKLAPHLTPAQARRVAAALLRFAGPSRRNQAAGRQP